MDLYYVGGTADWNGTAGTKWAASSGGAGGLATPTASDRVFFDANSGSGVVTIASGNTGAASIDFTGFTGTLAGSVSIIVSGGVTLGAGMTFSYMGALTFDGVGTLTRNGVTMDCPIVVNGASANLTIGDNVTTGATRAFTLTAGAASLNGQTLSIGSFSSTGTGTRSIDFTNSTIELKATSGTIWTTADATNLTITGADTGVILVSAATASSRSITMDSSPIVICPSINITAGSSTISMTNANCYNFTTGASYTGVTSGSLRIFGSFYLHANAANSSANVVYAASSGSHTINYNGNTGGFMSVNALGATYTLASAYSTTGTCTISGGTFRTNNHNINADYFWCTGANAKDVDTGTSQITCTNSGTVIDLRGSNLTYSGASTTFILNNNSTSSKNVYLSGKTIGTLQNNTLSTGPVFIIPDSGGTIDRLTVGTTNRIFEFAANFPATINDFDLNGTSGNPVILRTGTDSASPWSIIYGGAGVVSCDWLNIKNSQASPANTWYVGANSVDSGNNTGLVFDVPPVAEDGYRNLLLLGAG